MDVTGFDTLHTSGCFTMPNVWDAGSARLLASFGFHALGTTSAGLAYQLGLPDAEGRITLHQALDNIRSIAAAVPVPVSADFENGYADDPDSVADNVRRCADTGAAGCSIEDWDGSKFYPRALAVERIAAAVEAANGIGSGFVVTARTEQFLHVGPSATDEAMHRIARFAEVGAHCVYAPGLTDRATIADVATSLDAPLNVLVGIAGMHARFDEMQALGVRRLSVGGSLVRVCLAAALRAGKEMAEGRFDFPDSAPGESELVERFATVR